MRKFFKVASVQSGKCAEAPCRKSCPAKVDVPTYIGLISKRKFKEAYEVIRAGIPFPSVCGRVCHHPCETACRRTGSDEALSIRALKRFPGDYLLANGGLPKPTVKPDNGQRIAIVGSGPTGMSAAFYLVQQGYGVTVFEAQKDAGGMMRFGIPNYRLPKDVLQAEIQVILDSGVEIKTGIVIGQDKTISSIFAEGYKSIFLALGANCSNKLGIPGEDFQGVVSGVDFLYALSNGDKEGFSGKKVAVVGAGNVASDAARSALRMGASEVSIYYRRSKSEMPVIESELVEIEQEGICINTMVNPIKILGTNSRVTGIELIKMQAGKLDSSNRYAPVEIPGSNYIVGVDIVLVAIGYHPNVQDLDGLEVTKWGSVAVNKETMATSLPLVFAGGDCVTGATSIVEAIEEGKKAAAIIDRALGGSGILSQIEVDIGFKDSFSLNTEPKPRYMEKSIYDVDSFCETNLGYNLNMAIAEAERCLHCDLVCNVCEKVCPVLAAKGKKLGSKKSASIDADRCAGCGICEQRCPDQAIVLLERECAQELDTDVPLTLGAEVDKLCRKAHMNPEQVVCYCHRVKASEVAAAILSGARTPEAVAKLTGARTGCGVLCANSTMRQLEAAGIALDKAPGYQWYGGVPTIWKIPEEVLLKYDKEYRLLSDRKCMDKLFPNE